MELGTSNDRKMNDVAPTYFALVEHFSVLDYLLADTGLIGDGAEFFYVFKKGIGLYFALRRAHNRCVQKVCMVNEWAVGYMSNRHNIFLRRWYFSP